MNTESTRRAFLKTAGATAASASILSGTLLSDIAAATPLGVRRNLGGMSATDPVLLTYRRGIKAMKALSQSDPRSWSYQAAIHGTLITPTLPAWNTCQHGALFFWSWHRMYLYWFERIVRKLAGDCDPCWSLPYWDWTSPTQRQVPAPFRETTSDLFHPTRNPAMNNGTGSLSAAATSITGPFALVDFVSASGGISFGPHGAVHVGVGGDMGSVPRAAQDPLFYVHHCNVDRLWNLWIAQGGGRSNPLGDTAWRTTKYTFFTENGVEVAMTSCQVLRAAEQLDYVYEGEPDQVRQYCERRIRFPIFEIAVIAQFPLPRIILSEKPTSVPLPLDTVRQRLRSLATSTTENVLLVLEDVEADRPPGAFWEVHLGAVKPETAGVDSPTFVGTLALFGEGIKSEGHHETKPTRVVFPIRAPQLRSLAAGPARQPLTFILRGILVGGKPAAARPDAPISIGRVSLVVETRKEGENPGT